VPSPTPETQKPIAMDGLLNVLVWGTIEYPPGTVAAQQNWQIQESGYPQCYPQSDIGRSVRFMIV
jgi:hypothetical protein